MPEKPGRIEDIRSIIQTHLGQYKIEIEIGCGNGHFLADYGRKFPDRFLIGVDKKPKRCRKALKKINNTGFNHIAVLCGRAENLILNLPDGTVSVFHIYFPDPWPKNKHRRRRFMRMVHLDFICRAMKQGGKIHFATDYFDYYLQAKILFALHPGLNLNSVLPPQELFASVFSLRFTEQEKQIYFTSALKE
jgi:tRNA (guanine-N7-)-methyltransferase